MKYMGSKRRIAKYILPIILENRKKFQYYVEPFVGGANIIDKVSGNRIGSDINKYIIALLKHMQKEDLDLPFIGEDEYKKIQKNKELYPDWLVGYVGFQLSFAAKFFGGYRRDKVGKRDYEKEAQQNLLNQKSLLKDIEFYHCSYNELKIPKNSIIYCDPPYIDTTKYKHTFDHELFWKWCEDQHNIGHKVFISEYKAPSGWNCIWSKEVSNSLDKSTIKRGIEKLWVRKIS